MRSIISSSVSSSNCSKGFSHLGYGELVLGIVVMDLATCASHEVASFLLPVVSSSRLKFCKEGGVSDSFGGKFSLSELSHSGSSKYQGLYSGLGGYGPESDVMLFFLGVSTPGSLLGLVFPSLVGFYQG